ncbi:MAG: hypothetical protein PHH18_10745 [Acidobacteriota bacterium]|nr:hypothetical protein [Acidobacteriota bacterium]
MLKPAKATIFPAAMFLFLAGAAAPLFGQNIELSLSRSTLSFPAADPDATPLVPANDTLTVRLKLTGGGRPGRWQLTLRADGNLINILSLTSIDISNITWTASPAPPFRNGRLAANVDQLAAEGDGNVNITAVMNFVFQNSWSYWAGSYRQSVTFTLSRV